jgi:hypothetical protein
MMPTSDAFMTSSKRNAKPALAVCRVNARLIGGCFYR